ncbi:MAG: hypothetical protein ACRCW7_06770 [Cetobacterium sp.]
MSGLIGVKNSVGNVDMISKIKANCISYEGFTTYGSLSNKVLEALTIDLLEGIDENLLRYRNYFNK